MLFNSLQFGIFFIIVYTLYLCLNHRWQNRLLLLASYIFYSAWDWRFLSLILISTVLDYFCGIKIHETTEPKKKRLFLFLSIFVNLSILGFFKYFNFFIHNLVALLNLFGLSIDAFTLGIILPLGISFYTFQTMSYTIDIYRKEVTPTKHFFDFALFVSFFPQLVAGPIERAKHLLPQILKPRKISAELFYEGAHLIFWGLFQKVFIADNMAKIVDPVFSNGASVTGGEILIASYAFCVQAFCDFAGYSNMARGLGKMMGFDIMINFRLPYFVTNPQEFWNHWHISLSSWVRDYIYFPLFSALKKIQGNIRVFSSILIAMALMGLWHGAAWNFILWGVYNGLVILIYLIVRAKTHSWITPKKTVTKKLWLLVRLVLMFHVSMIGMLIFRATGFAHVVSLLRTLFTNCQFNGNTFESLIKLIGFTSPFLIIHLGQYLSGDLLFLFKRHWVIKTFVYALMLYLLLGWGVMTQERFIYFQF